MNQRSRAFTLSMNNGTRYRIQPCVEPGTQHTPDFLRGQIIEAMAGLSSQSLWDRFAGPVNSLSERQLDYLTSLDGRDRVAWCASVDVDGRDRGIALGRYVRLAEEPDVAEFALTVIDEFQGQGIGRQLLSCLVDTARENGLRILRGQLTTGNRAMLALCREFGAVMHRDPPNYLTADIPVSPRSQT